MGKKPKQPPALATSDSAALTHSPFAALSGAKPQPPEPSARESGGVHEAVPTAPPSTEASRAPRGRLILRRETKHRRGNAVVVVSGFGTTGLPTETLETLAGELKRALGCGGALERTGNNHELVLQGDQPAKVAELLRARGFRVGGVTE